MSELTTNVISRCLKDFSWQVQGGHGPCPGRAEVKGQISASHLGTALISTSSTVGTHRKCCGGKRIKKLALAMVACTANPNAKEAEAGGLKV